MRLLSSALFVSSICIATACGSPRTCASYGGQCRIAGIGCPGVGELAPNGKLPNGDDDDCNKPLTPAGAVCCLPCPTGTVPDDGGPGCH